MKLTRLAGCPFPEPFPSVFCLVVFQDHINAEIASGTVKSKQDVMEYLTWTYFFRRIMQNPSYYGLDSVDKEEVALFLSGLIEETLEDLEQAGCIEITDDDVDGGDDNNGDGDDDGKKKGERGEIQPLLLGRVASFYYLHYATAALFRDKIHRDLSLQEAFETLCAASEYDEMPVRHNEEILNAELGDEIMEAGGWEVDAEQSDDPHFKVNVMFQAHFSHLPLPISDYLGKPISAFSGKSREAANDRNIATLARFYNGKGI